MIVWRIWENMTSQLPEELVPHGTTSMRLCKACRMEMLVWQGINVGILTVSVKFIPLKFPVHSCRSLLFLSPPLSLSLSLSLSPMLLSSATSHAKWRIGAAVYWGYTKKNWICFLSFVSSKTIVSSFFIKLHLLVSLFLHVRLFILTVKLCHCERSSYSRVTLMPDSINIGHTWQSFAYILYNFINIQAGPQAMNNY